jgi:hypothetical protein
MTSRSVVFAEPVRTAIGTFGGSLKDISVPDLGATAIRAAVARAGVRPDEVETVVMGNVVQAGTKMNPARQAAVHAGLPVTTPVLTVNRVCGSGAQAIVSAAPVRSLTATRLARPARCSRQNQFTRCGATISSAAWSRSASAAAKASLWLSRHCIENTEPKRRELCRLRRFTSSKAVTTRIGWQKYPLPFKPL